MVPRDVDNDYPFTYVLVDKRFETLHARPVPRNEVYSYDTHNYLEVHPDRQRELDNETERFLTLNLEVATREMSNYLDTRNRKFYREKENRERLEAEAKKPIKQRIKETCEYCAKGIGFQSPESIVREGRPVPPLSWRHDLGEPSNTNGGGYCKAYSLRKLEAGIPPTPEPEPRWCPEPTCRARMRDSNSRKGVEDKDTCLNNYCPSRKPKKRVTKPKKVK